MGNAAVASIYVRAVLARDPLSVLYTVVGCALAAAVAIFQFTVFSSFIAAAAVGPHVLGGDVWVSAHGVHAFEFSSPIDDGFGEELLRYFPGAQVRRVAFAFVPWISPDGGHSSLALIGADHLSIPPSTVDIDRHDSAILEVPDTGGAAQVGAASMDVRYGHADLTTFLGAPYGLSNFEQARLIMGFPPNSASFLVFDLPSHYPADNLDHEINLARNRFPDLSISTSNSFAFNSAWYWVEKTGAGIAIMLGAALASLLMLIVLSNGISRLVQRRRSDLLSLRGAGATNEMLIAILALSGLALTGCAVFIALLIVPMLNLILNSLIPWVRITPVVFAFALGMTLLSGITGFLSSLNEVRRLPLSEIFRS